MLWVGNFFICVMMLFPLYGNFFELEAICETTQEIYEGQVIKVGYCVQLPYSFNIHHYYLPLLNLKECSYLGSPETKLIYQKNNAVLFKITQFAKVESCGNIRVGPSLLYGKAGRDANLTVKKGLGFCFQVKPQPNKSRKLPVGQFQMKLQYPKKVVGGVFNIELTVMGSDQDLSGLDVISFDSWIQEGLKVSYVNSVVDHGGCQKTFTYQVDTSRYENRYLPAFEWHYFDPYQHTQVTLSQAPYKITEPLTEKASKNKRNVVQKHSYSKMEVKLLRCAFWKFGIGFQGLCLALFVVMTLGCFCFKNNRGDLID